MGPSAISFDYFDKSTQFGPDAVDMILNKLKRDFMTSHIRVLIVIMSSMNNNKINLSLFLEFSQQCANIRDSKLDQNIFPSNFKRFFYQTRA